MAPMRMTWWRELKWLLASHLLGWSLRLISEEMSGIMAQTPQA